MVILIDEIEYLTSREAAQRAHRSVDAIALWCRQKKVKARKDRAGRWWVMRASLEDFLRGNSSSDEAMIHTEKEEAG